MRLAGDGCLSPVGYRFTLGAAMRQNGHVDLIGTSPAITELKAEVTRVARSDAKVLITGESGTGKEVIARAINSASPRSQQAFAGQLRGDTGDAARIGVVWPCEREFHR